MSIPQTTPISQQTPIPRVTPRYNYEPLPPLRPYGPTPPYTRLVRILPGNDPGPIHCSLFVVSVEEAPPFETLSYVWGAPAKGADKPYVLCDGRPVSITPNLDYAMRWLRDGLRERVVWIDAICIDQENLDERSRQVEYMRCLVVYKNSTRTIVWLGPKQPGFDLAFETARRLRILNNTPDIDLSNIPDLHLILGMTEDELEIGRIYISELLNVEYFTRIWCVQEVVASRESIAKCEDQEIKFEELLELVSFVSDIGERNPDKPLLFWRGIPHLQRHFAKRQQQGFEASVGSLLITLACTKNFKATDPRDKLFALLGITDEGLSDPFAWTNMTVGDGSLKDRVLRKAVKGLASFVQNYRPVGMEDKTRPEPLRPNYKKPVREVYRDFARYMLHRTPRVLDILSYVQHSKPPGQDEYPSWVPRWDEPRQTSPLAIPIFRTGFGNDQFRHFATIDDRLLNGKPIDPEKLGIEGFKVDQVVKVTDTMQFGPRDHFPAEAIWRQLFDFPMFPTSEAEQMRQYRNGERLDTAFLLTAAAYPLSAMVTSMDFQNPENNFRNAGQDLETLMNELKARSRSIAAAFILANTPLDTTLLPHFEDINTEAANEDGLSYNQIGKTFTNNRKFYLTRAGYLGIGPAMMQPGDEVCVFFGGIMPYILRPMGGYHFFIGDSYLLDDDIMYGKAADAVKNGLASGSPIVKFELR